MHSVNIGHMEITLDWPLIRDILKTEYARARADIRQLGASRALEQSRERHDAQIAASVDFNTLACRAGCTWCCYFSVDVRAVEAFSILDFVEQTFSPQEQERIYSEVRANSVVFSGLSENERATRNLKCPFLSDGRCGIYAARPQSCRNYHATDAAGCQKSFEDPQDFDIDPEFAPGVYQVGGAHVEAFNGALEDAGYDIAAYELNCAINAALSDAGARQRFESKLKPFLALSGVDVVPEFDEAD